MKVTIRHEFTFIDNLLGTHVFKFLLLSVVHHLNQYTLIFQANQRKKMGTKSSFRWRGRDLHSLVKI